MKLVPEYQADAIRLDPEGGISRAGRALVLAAQDLFGQRGFESTTIRDIGDRAGVDAALIARYFGSKADLYIAAVVFVITAHMDWAAAGLVAAGAILGGMLGARVGRRLPPAALRALIVVIGIVAILKLVL